LKDDMPEARMNRIKGQGSMDAYLKAAEETAVYPGAGTGSNMALAYAALGLVNEAGEVAGKIKKHLRGDDNVDALSEERKQAIAAELGDVAWYYVMLCNELGIWPSDTLALNIEKLQNRKREGTLKGDGDQR